MTPKEKREINRQFLDGHAIEDIALEIHEGEVCHWPTSGPCGRILELRATVEDAIRWCYHHPEKRKRRRKP